VFDQIRGFGEYGFPESHAASFALIAYATSWLRRHYLAEFTCSLLNAQPMGFYSPSTIVGDAQRHGVEVRPIDITASEWDCTLEGTGNTDEHGEPVLAVRMGLRWVKGLSLDEGQQLVRARRVTPFDSLEDFSRRTQLSSRVHGMLAECGALGSIVASRRDALWQLGGWARRQNDSLSLGGDVDADVRFPNLDTLDAIVWDHRASDHSTRGHALKPLRSTLRGRGLPDARQVSSMRDGQRIDYAGLVICRQRPATASGVVFMTLEDETGFVNLVVWKQVLDEYSLLARTTSFLGVSGPLQVQEGIVHLIAELLWKVDLPRDLPEPASHDFH
jgi:error-prone DNA polymerase